MAETADPAPAAQPLDLTPEESAWIKAHPEIRMGMVADNAPYSFFRDDAFQGFSVDLVHRVEDLTGLRITLRMGSWGQIYTQFIEGRLDAIEAISYTEARARTIVFTEPYYLRRTMVFQNLDHPLPSLDGPDALEGMRVGIIRDIYYADSLTERGYTVVPYDTYRELIADLAFGWIDAVLAPELTGQFFARENGFSNVGVAGPLPVTELALEDFRFGVLRTSPVLRSILDKALATIPDPELNAMVDHWRSARPGLTLTAGPLRLLPQEQAFIAERPVVRVGFMPDYWPFSYLEDGRAHGFAVELVQEIGDRSGLTIEPVFDSWPRLVESLRMGTLDMIGNMSFTEDRAERLLFTKPYHTAPNAVFVRSGFGRYTGLSDLNGLRVGIPGGVYFQDPLIAQLGSDAVITFAQQASLMRALANGQVDAVITSLSHGTALVRRLGLMSIEVGGEFRLVGVGAEDLRFATGATNPFLRGIVDRVMASIPMARWAELENRWLGPRMATQAPDRVPLSPNEQVWLDKKGVLRVCGGATFDPYELFKDDGTYQGVAGDLMRLLARRGGFDWELVPAKSRDEALANARAGRCDLLPFVMGLPETLPGWVTTKPYLRMPAVAATLLEQPFLQGMASLSGQAVGVDRNSPLRATLEARYPNLTLVPMDSEEAGLEALRVGRVYATIGSLPRLGYLIARERMPEIKIAGNLPEEHRVSIAIPADMDLLASILNRLIGAMGEAETQQILDRWVTVRFERTVDVRLIWGIIAGALTLIVLFVLWNRQLHRLNSRLNAANARLHELSVTDGLTGLPNRTSMESRMAETFAVCQRNGLPFAIAMIDVDHFKAVNDELGHAFGDSCLRQIGEILATHFRRDGDVVGRFGGEEFVTFTAGESAHKFPGHVEALRIAIAAHTVTDRQLTRRITVSIGYHVAQPDRGDTIGAFLEAADRSLYRAKETGRNRVLGNRDANADVGADVGAETEARAQRLMPATFDTNH